MTMLVELQDAVFLEPLKGLDTVSESLVYGYILQREEVLRLCIIMIEVFCQSFQLKNSLLKAVLA